MCKNGLYYAVGDIHGYKNLLVHAIDYIRSREGKKVIFLGDYIDRGPDSLGVLNFVMSPPEDMEFICLAGNHEDMVYESYRQYREIDYYCDVFAKQAKNVNMKPYIYWIENLKLFHIEKNNNIFAHAYFDGTLPPHEQQKNCVLWDRYGIGEDFYSTNGSFLTHGHTTHVNGPEMTANRFNLDCGAKYGKQLCVGIYHEDVKGAIGYCMIYSDGSYKENIWNNPQ